MIDNRCNRKIKRISGIVTFILFSSYYGPEAILCHPSLSTALVNKLYDLNDLEFDLPCVGHELDISWPAFSRYGYINVIICDCISACIAFL